MPLINCPECNKRISDKVYSCPNCGYPIAHKKDTSKKKHNQLPLSQKVSTHIPYNNKTKLATWSMILGLTSFLCSIFTAVPAIICGHISLSQIKKSGGKQSGKNKALTGVICGYIAIGIFIIFSNVSNDKKPSIDQPQAGLSSFFPETFCGKYVFQSFGENAKKDIIILYPNMTLYEETEIPSMNILVKSRGSFIIYGNKIITKISDSESREHIITFKQRNNKTILYVDGYEDYPHYKEEN